MLSSVNLANSSQSAPPLVRCLIRYTVLLNSLQSLKGRWDLLDCQHVPHTWGPSALKFQKVGGGDQDGECWSVTCGGQKYRFSSCFKADIRGYQLYPLISEDGILLFQSLMIPSPFFDWEENLCAGFLDVLRGLFHKAFSFVLF